VRCLYLCSCVRSCFVFVVAVCSDEESVQQCRSDLYNRHEPAKCEVPIRREFSEAIQVLLTVTATDQTKTSLTLADSHQIRRPVSVPTTACAHNACVNRRFNGFRHVEIAPQDSQQASLSKRLRNVRASPRNQ
jgi:hypothetical protein